MEITEVRIKLMEDPGERLQAFCSITFDHCFVIRDLKIIGGTNGSFVAMPSRRLTSHCPQCGCKNHLKSGYCNQCGMRLRQDSGREDDGRTKLYADIAHPINQACRDLIQQKVIEAFHVEQERAKQPGYVSSYDDFDEDVSPAPRRHSGPTRRDDAHRRHDQRRDEPRREEPRREEARETVIRKVPAAEPPSAPTPTPTSEPSRAPETTKIEPAAAEPRPPHTPASTPNDPAKEPKKSGFGEGIL